MIRWTPLLATLGLLAGCAAGNDTNAQAQTPSCGVADARTGSLVVRREACVATTEEERAAARRQMEAMQREQERQRRGAGPSGT